MSRTECKSMLHITSCLADSISCQTMHSNPHLIPKDVIWRTLKFIGLESYSSLNHIPITAQPPVPGELVEALTESLQESQPRVDLVVVLLGLRSLSNLYQEIASMPASAGLESSDPFSSYHEIMRSRPQAILTLPFDIIISAALEILAGFGEHNLVSMITAVRGEDMVVVPQAMHDHYWLRFGGLMGSDEAFQAQAFNSRETLRIVERKGERT